MATTAQTLREHYQKRSQDSYKVGYTQALWERGALETLNDMIFKGFKGDGHRFKVEKSRPTKSAARHPMSTAKPVGGRGDLHDIRIYPGQMSRDIDTPTQAQNIMDDHDDQGAIDGQLSAGSFFSEFLQMFFHGDGSFQDKGAASDLTSEGENLCGIDWWMDQYSGAFVDGTLDVSGTNYGQYYSSKFAGQKVFDTNDGVPDHLGANQNVFSQTTVDDALTLIKGQPATVIVSPRKTWVQFKKVLNALGGNTTQHMINNKTVPGYDGTPWLISDTVFGEKYSSEGGEIKVGDLDIVEVAGEGEDNFVGFSDGDVGREITVAGADFGSGSETTTIKTIIDRRRVRTADSAAAAVATGAEVTVAGSDNGFYVLRLNDMRNTLCAIYGLQSEATEASYGKARAGEYYGSIAGFDVLDLGILQEGGNIRRRRAIWDGNFVLENPFSVTRVTNFKFA